MITMVHGPPPIRGDPLLEIHFDQEYELLLLQNRGYPASCKSHQRCRFHKLFISQM